MSDADGTRLARLRAVSWRDVLSVGVPVALVVVAAGAFAAKLMQSAPPSHFRMISGSAGSSYRNLAEKYKKIIESHGVKVEIVPSEGALDNLERLAEPRSAVDVGFVQGGLADGVDISTLVSLGTVFTQPLMVYYRLPQPIDRLTALRGKRIAIGPAGSGTHALALKLLKANDMDEKSATLVTEHGEEAARSLVAGKLDAAFLMGDSATPQVMRGLREAPGVRLMSFRQADGYVRRLKFLTHLTLPEGAMDLGKDYPSENVSLVGSRCRARRAPGSAPRAVGPPHRGGARDPTAARHVPHGGRVPRAARSTTSPSAATPSATTSRAASSSTSGSPSGSRASSTACSSSCCRCS